jgi:hypothetical protein
VVTSVILGGGEPRISHEGPVEPLEPPRVPGFAPRVALTLPCAADRTDARGATRVRGVPQLLDERIWILAGFPERESYAGLILGAFGSSQVAEIRLPDEPTWVWPNRDGRRGRGGRRNLRASCEALHVPSRLEVVAFRRDGRPAAGVPVTLGYEERLTDDYGRAVFGDIRRRSSELKVGSPDFVWSSRSVTMSGGESRIVEVLEPPGWTAVAALHDSVGRRVPFARVRVASGSRVEYVRVEDGVQDLALHTDPNGEISLPRMHHGPVTLTFSYGSRSESVTIDESEPYRAARLPPPR